MKKSIWVIVFCMFILNMASAQNKINDSGAIGIGTTTPLNLLHIENGDLRITNDLGTGGDGKASIVFSEISNSTEAHARITYHGDDVSGDENYLGFGLGDYTDKDFVQFAIQRSGNVGIGTTSPDYKLDVIGTIRAQELKVNMEGADFVFAKDYNLLPLNKLERFVEKNQHLPEVAPAKVMQEEGVKQSEMNQKLLQKIEELVLYTIQQQKEIEQLRKEIEDLK